MRLTSETFVQLAADIPGREHGAAKDTERRRIGALLAGVTALFFVMGLFFGLTARSRLGILIGGAEMGVGLCIAFYFTRIALGRAVDVMSISGGPGGSARTSISLDEQGVRTIFEKGDTFHSWEALTDWSESERGYLIAFPGGQQVWIPAFALSPEMKTFLLTRLEASRKAAQDR